MGYLAKHRNRTANGIERVSSDFDSLAKIRLILALFVGAAVVVGDVVNYGRHPEEFTKLYAMESLGIGLADMGLFVAFIGFYFLTLESKRLLLSRNILIIVLIICLSSGNGYLRHGLNQGNFFADIRVYLWFFGGIIVALLLREAGKMRLGLVLMVCLGSVLLVVSSKQSVQDLTVSGARATSVSFFYCSEYLLAPTALLLALYLKRSWFIGILAFTSILLQLYTGVVLGETKSILVEVVIISFLGVLSAGVKQANDNRRQYDHFNLVYYALACAAVGWIAFQLSSNNNLAIEDRLVDYADLNYSMSSRVEEVADLFPQFEIDTLFLGQGTGGVFYSAINQSGIAGDLHIGIFTFLWKFGVLVFAWIVWFGYIYLPVKYFQSVTGIGMPNRHRIVYAKSLPGIFSWLAILTMSGGFNIYAAYGGGFAFGILIILKQESRRGGLNVRIDRCEMKISKRIGIEC